MHVLVVDDNKNVRDVLNKLLVSLGYSVDIAVNGLDGFEKAQEKPYHLYIIDHLMPLMNGVVLSKNLKKIPLCASTPILFMTTQEKNSVKKLPEFSLFNSIMSKPLNEIDFIAVVKLLTEALKDKASQK
jgi:two-component system chemotaxis response regulator CheY